MPSREFGELQKELTAALSKARETDAPLSEKAWELLSATVDGVVAGVFLANPAAQTEIAEISLEAIMAALGGVGAAMAIATAIPVGTILTLQLLGMFKLEHHDIEKIEFIERLAGGPFPLVSGAIGAAFDGQYGLEVGVSAGQFAGILLEGREVAKAWEEKEKFRLTALHALQLAKELTEIPGGPEEHVFSESSAKGGALNARRMARNLIEDSGRVSRPVAQRVTDGAAVPVARDEYAAMADLEYVLSLPVGGQIQNPPPPPNSPRAGQIQNPPPPPNSPRAGQIQNPPPPPNSPRAGQIQNPPPPPNSPRAGQIQNPPPPPTSPPAGQIQNLSPPSSLAPPWAAQNVWDLGTPAPGGPEQAPDEPTSSQSIPDDGDLQSNQFLLP